MGSESQINRVRQQLARLPAPTQAAARWRAHLLNYQHVPEKEDDAHAWLACCLAWQAVVAGNFGVGAILVDEQGRIIAQGHNQMFHPHFRSDRHAEMVVLDRWEAIASGRPACTLVTSVEPCPMCLVRLISSPVRQVLYLAPDPMGGMVRRMDALPPYWAEAAQGKSFTQADCSASLIQAAHEIFLLNLQELTTRLKTR